MEWRIVAALGVGFAAVFGLKFIGSVQPSTAREPLRPGARVIDVRSPEEFRARHLPVTITIPLGELSEQHVDVAVQFTSQRRAQLKFAAKRGGIHPQCIA